MEQKQTQKRKAYAQRGQRSSKMMSFRIDDQVARWLSHAANKGRLINELITSWATQQPWYDEDADPAENDIEEYLM